MFVKPKKLTIFLNLSFLGMAAVIPPRKNRTTKMSYNEDLYKLRHLIKNAFCISNSGAASPHDLPKMTPYSLPPFRSDASLSGLTSRDRHYLTLI